MFSSVCGRKKEKRSRGQETEKSWKRTKQRELKCTVEDIMQMLLNYIADILKCIVRKDMRRLIPLL